MLPPLLGRVSPDRVPVIDREDYTVSYERADEVIFAHVQVRRWTHKVRTRFLKDIDAAQELLGEPVYGLEELSSPRQVKFMISMGFIRCGRVYEASSGALISIFCRPVPGKPYLIFNA